MSKLRAFRTHLVIVLLTACLECDRSMRMWPFRQMRIERTSGQRALIGTTAAQQIRDRRALIGGVASRLDRSGRIEALGVLRCRGGASGSRPQEWNSTCPPACRQSHRGHPVARLRCRPWSRTTLFSAIHVRIATLLEGDLAQRLHAGSHEWPG